MPKSTYIALGSNLGSQEKNLRLAAAELQKISTSPCLLYTSDSADYPVVVNIGGVRSVDYKDYAQP